MIDSHGNHKEPDCDSEITGDELYKTDNHNAASDQYNKASNQPGWKGWHKNPEYVFSCCVAVFTFVLTVTSILQWKVMSDNQRATERAWIVVKGVKLDAPLAEGVTATVIAGFHNSGHSPALQMFMTNAVTIVASLPLGNMPKFPNDSNRSLSVVGPDRQASSTIGLIVSKEDIINLQAKKSDLYSFGTIEYVDIFGTNHWTNFCFRTVSLTNLNLVACPRWNDVDNN